MPKTKSHVAKRKAATTQTAQLDGVYLLKLLLYVLLGSMWLKLNHGASTNIPIPVGFIAGLIFTTHEHFRIDRKIEYAVMLVAMLVGYFAPYGLYISF